ncbi:MAG TPA: hypothetical protein VFZ81_06615, partial [Burkholderiales bacterium]
VRDRPLEPLLSKIPTEIAVAIGLLWLQVALGVASFWFQYLRTPEDERRLLLIIGSVMITVVCVLNVCIALRQNWARWTYLTLVIVGFGSLFVTLDALTVMPDYEVALEAISYVIDLGLLVLLFARPGALWFRFQPAP